MPVRQAYHCSTAARKPYNRHLSHTGLKAAGKAALVVAGVAFGFHRGISGGRADAEVPAVEASGAVPMPEAPSSFGTEANARPEGHGYVTREQLEVALEQVRHRFEAELDRRFETQNHSIGALYSLVSQTDRLLERVLLHLEDAAGVSEPDGSEAETGELSPDLPFTARRS